MRKVVFKAFIEGPRSRSGSVFDSIHAHYNHCPAKLQGYPVRPVPHLDFGSERVTLEAEATPILKGGAVMADVIVWEAEMDNALARGQAEKKPVLLDFFNPG
jgi:hypothetical protein